MMCSGHHGSQHWPWCSADAAATLVTCSCKVGVMLQISKLLGTANKLFLGHHSALDWALSAVKERHVEATQVS